MASTAAGIPGTMDLTGDVSRSRNRLATVALLLVAALLSALAFGPGIASAKDKKRILLYTGTTGYRHSDAINNGRAPVTTALQAAGYTVDWEDCDNNGGGANNCDNANKNPRIFSDDNLAKYDAIFLFNASSAHAGGGRPGPLWTDAQKAAIIRFIQAGGGIAANHNATDMSAGAVTWDWWDGNDNSVVGTTMKGHAATDQNNKAEVQVQDHHHLSTKDLDAPGDVYLFGDEHYNYNRSTRGTHHVLMNLDERKYNPGSNRMGQDHPISWCKLYDGDLVNDGTATPKPYNDGRAWVTGMGHFGSDYTANGGNNNLIKHIVGGVRWVAGEGKKSDCSGTVWTSFKRTILVNDVNGPIGLDVAPDGKVYWTEIGPNPGYESEGYIKMYDPQGGPNNKTTVATIPTRADHGNSEDGVLGMSLQPGFDLNDPAKRDVYVYYSPRPGTGDNWPTSGASIAVGYNQISRFTLTADGTAVVPNSERVILRVPKAKISGSPSGFPGGPTDSGPGHVGGAGLVFDSAGNLYLGVGDDVSPNAPGHGGLTPMDYRASERWDARKTSANSADLRGKVLRITPMQSIPAGATPGVGTTYTIPAGNMFAPGTPKTRPEIYAMGFRQPFTVHADPKNAGTVVVGEYCHDTSSNVANRAPAGTCEWDLIDKPQFQGWPFCMGDNSPANTSWRWDYQNNKTTGEQYDCSLAKLPTDINWAPAGQTAAKPTFDGLDELPGPAAQGTIWRKYPGASGGQSTADFGDLSAGGMSPITGPIYRYDAKKAKPGAFPPYYDGAWFIANRGDNGGFWKEVRLTSDTNKMLRVDNWVPTSQFGAPNNSYVIPTRFGPDGALYMARWTNGCCRSSLNASTQTELVKIEFAVQDQCLEDTLPPVVNPKIAGREHPLQPGKYVDGATLSLLAGDQGCAGVKSIEYRMGAGGAWKAYDAPLVFDKGGTYDVDYRATDNFDNTSAVKRISFEVVELNDKVAPGVSATLSGAQNEKGHFLGTASLQLKAVDQLSPIASIEYRINQEETWTKVAFNDENLTQQISREISGTGYKYVEFRATDVSGNTSEVSTVDFAVQSGCLYKRSDEFDGNTIDARWLRHQRNGGTPDTGPMAPYVSGGQLHMVTNNQEIDGNNATTQVGPINFLGQDLPQLGNNWEVETQFTVKFTGGWQHAGLIVWIGDNNFFRSTITHSLTSGEVYVEQSKDNPSSTEGARSQAGSNITILSSKQPVTIRMRYQRIDGSNTVKAQYRVMAPASVAMADWRDFGGASNFLDLNPSSGPRRDAAGSRVGIIAAGNFPGTTGNHPYNGVPATVDVDYFRVTPDELVSCPEADVTPPATTASLDPAEPGEDGTYDEAVTVKLSATDDEEETATGVKQIEWSVDGGSWQTEQNADDDSPFEAEFEVSEPGDHTIRYRARDNGGNLEVAKVIPVRIAKPDLSGVRDIYADGTSWVPDALTIPTGDKITWHFDPPASHQPHDVWLRPPGASNEIGGGMFQVTKAPVMPGGDPVSYEFRKSGKWQFICMLHSTRDAVSGEWNGMTGTIDVEGDDLPDPGEKPDPKPDPDPDPKPDPDPDPKPDPKPVPAKVLPLAKTSAGAFAKYGLEVKTQCQTGQRGAVSIELSANEAKKIGLKKATTLAKKSILCGPKNSAAVTLKPSAKLAKALSKARGAVTATVKVTMGSGKQATTNSRKLVLRPVKSQVGKLPRTTLATFLKKGVKVPAQCEAGKRSTVKLTVSAAVARKLGLGKNTTLASKSIACGRGDKGTATLKPSAKVKRALAKVRGAVQATVQITTGSGKQASKHSRKLVLAAGGR
jgi:plastocyanin